MKKVYYCNKPCGLVLELPESEEAFIRLYSKDGDKAELDYDTFMVSNKYLSESEIDIQASWDKENEKLGKLHSEIRELESHKFKLLSVAELAKKVYSIQLALDYYINEDGAVSIDGVVEEVDSAINYIERHSKKVKEYRKMSNLEKLEKQNKLIVEEIEKLKTQSQTLKMALITCNTMIMSKMTKYFSDEDIFQFKVLLKVLNDDFDIKE